MGVTDSDYVDRANTQTAKHINTYTFTDEILTLSRTTYTVANTHTLTHIHSHIHFITFMFFSGADFVAVSPRAGLPVAKDDSSNTAILIGCLVGIILLLLAVIAVILWRQYWKKILGKVKEERLSAGLSKWLPLSVSRIFTFLLTVHVGFSGSN